MKTTSIVMILSLVVGCGIENRNTIKKRANKLTIADKSGLSLAGDSAVDGMFFGQLAFSAVNYLKDEELAIQYTFGIAVPEILNGKATCQTDLLRPSSNTDVNFCGMDNDAKAGTFSRGGGPEKWTEDTFSMDFVIADFRNVGVVKNGNAYMQGGENVRNWSADNNESVKNLPRQKITDAEGSVSILYARSDWFPQPVTIVKNFSGIESTSIPLNEEQTKILTEVLSTVNIGKDLRDVGWDGEGADRSAWRTTIDLVPMNEIKSFDTKALRLPPEEAAKVKAQRMTERAEIRAKLEESLRYNQEMEALKAERNAEAERSRAEVDAEDKFYAARNKASTTYGLRYTCPQGSNAEFFNNNELCGKVVAKSSCPSLYTSATNTYQWEEVFVDGIDTDYCKVTITPIASGLTLADSPEATPAASSPMQKLEQADFVISFDFRSILNAEVKVEESIKYNRVNGIPFNTQVQVK